jgi:hypothetical protein
MDEGNLVNKEAKNWWLDIQSPFGDSTAAAWLHAAVFVGLNVGLY